MDICWVCAKKKGQYRERFEKSLCNKCFKGLVKLAEYQIKVSKITQSNIKRKKRPMRRQHGRKA